jgi:hypothetical protein
LAPYKWAVVRLATCVAAREACPRLVFGSVSLLEPGRPPQPDGPVERAAFGPTPRARGRVFFRRVCLRAAEAVGWYRAAGPGTLRTPMPADPGGRLDVADGTAVECGPLEDQPPWPELGLGGASDAHGEAEHPGTPFRWNQRVHRRFGRDEGFAGLLDDEEAVRFLARRLHVDLSRFPEHLGGLALVAPDPLLGRIEHFFVASDGGRDESLVLRFVSRRAGGLAGVTVALSEVRLGLIARAESFPVPDDGVVVRPGRGALGATGYAAAHPVLGLLRHEPPLPFVRDIHVHTETAAATFEIEAPLSDAADAPPERAIVTQYEAWGARFAAAAPSDTSARVLRADARRRRQALARRLDQTWLDTRRAAVDFLRERVRQARDRLWIADPYLGGLQLLQVAHHASRPVVAIRLLTSAEAFARRGEGEAWAHRAARVERFRAALEELRRREFADVEAFVLRGRPDLHDRFLVVDDRAWTIGNSLNGVGQRLSLALGIPDPDPVVERLDALVRAAEPFGDFAARYGPGGADGSGAGETR